MALVLCLGCSAGKSQPGPHVIAGDEVIEVESPSEASSFPDGHFDRVVVDDAAGNIGISETLNEAHRVLASRGHLFLTVRPLSIVLGEISGNGSLRRFLNLARAALSSMLFHIQGMTLSNTSLLLHSQRGLRIALRRAGFVSVAFSRSDGKIVVHARNTYPGRSAVSPASVRPSPQPRQLRPRPQSSRVVSPSVSFELAQIRHFDSPVTHP